jgi:hypothetical protein
MLVNVIIPTDAPVGDTVPISLAVGANTGVPQITMAIR